MTSLFRAPTNHIIREYPSLFPQGGTALAEIELADAIADHQIERAGRLAVQIDGASPGEAEHAARGN